MAAVEKNLESVARALHDQVQLREDALYLDLEECTLRLRSNSGRLLDKLRHYFAHLVSSAKTPDIDVVAIERDAPDLGLDFIDWKREPGKTGRKDAYLDLPAARLILKVRTGMVFLQSERQRIAAGPCLKYDNQVINFINAQYMNWLQHRQWLICHAAALAYHGRGFAVAGFSGGGKSTLMLKLLDNDGVSFITNDRLFVQKRAGETRARGIPKLPRVNPGTILHDPRLQHMIDPQTRQSLRALPGDELWRLEDKYDVDVEQIYGAGRIIHEAPLSAFLVLNWQRDGDTALEVAPVDLATRRDLLGAIMKSPGPFYQYPDGSFFRDDTAFDEQAYLAALEGVAVFEARGRVDFDVLAERCLSELMD